MMDVISTVLLLTTVESEHGEKKKREIVCGILLSSI